MRAELFRIVDVLAQGGPRVVSLDEISDAIGVMAISIEEIDRLFTSLEERGFTVGDDHAPPASTHLAAVLVAARQLRSELGRTPNAAEIAERSGLRIDEVRLALYAATIMQR